MLCNAALPNREMAHAAGFAAGGANELALLNALLCVRIHCASCSELQFASRLCVQPNEPNLCRFWLAALIAGVQRCTMALRAHSADARGGGSCHLQCGTRPSGLPYSRLRLLYMLLVGYLYMYTGHCVPVCLRAPLCAAIATLWLPPGTVPGVPALATGQRGHLAAEAGQVLPAESDSELFGDCEDLRRALLDIVQTDGALSGTLSTLLARLRPPAVVAEVIDSYPQSEFERRGGLMVAIVNYICESVAVSSDLSGNIDGGACPALFVRVAVRGSGLVASGAALGGSLRAEAEALLCSWRRQSIMDLVRGRRAVVCALAAGFTRPHSRDMQGYGTLADANRQLTSIAVRARRRGFKQAQLQVSYKVPVDMFDRNEGFRQAWFKQWVAAGGYARASTMPGTALDDWQGQELTSLQRIRMAATCQKVNAGGAFLQLIHDTDSLGDTLGTSELGSCSDCTTRLGEILGHMPTLSLS
jgi:hypothetical protein